MPDREPRRSGHAVTWGFFLLFLGTVLLLQNLELLPWDLWDTLWRLWPVLLILAGVDILVGRGHPWLAGFFTLLLLLACLLFAIWQYERFPYRRWPTDVHIQPSDELHEAGLVIDFDQAVAVRMDRLFHGGGLIRSAGPPPG